MFNLFVRTIIIYLTVFFIIRLMGKRQISDMQPFDLVVTLLIADVSAVPISDSAIPLMYGIIPILSLFLLHRLVAYLSLKSKRMRALVCGNPLIIIEKGAVLEDAMRAANYSLGDLTEQLRVKDVFSISDVEYGILETNGSLSVLKKSDERKSPSVLLIADGKPNRKALTDNGLDENWLRSKLRSAGSIGIEKCFLAELDSNGMLFIQEKNTKSGKKPRVHFIKAVNE